MAGRARGWDLPGLTAVALAYRAAASIAILQFLDPISEAKRKS